jgi:hypothetical protein
MVSATAFDYYSYRVPEPYEFGKRVLGGDSFHRLDMPAYCRCMLTHSCYLVGRTRLRRGLEVEYRVHDSAADYIINSIAERADGE